MDGRCVTRQFGLWVESANWYDQEWLEQRQLREAIDRLRDNNLKRPFLWASRNLDPVVKKTMNQYLSKARWNLYEDFNRKVIEETLRLMKEDDCFDELDDRGDLLNQAVA